MLRLGTLSRRRSGRRCFIVTVIVAAFLLGGLFRNPFTKMQVTVDDRDCAEDCSGPKSLSTFGGVLTNRLKRSKGRELEKHVYLENGLLQVNPEGPHPIFELIQRAQQEWDWKLANASTTLEQAVAEYRRRYKRLPPRGFDKWWAYVEKNHVQLPDEYDQIYRDIEPFWGIDPEELQQTERDWEEPHPGHEDSYTIGKDTYDDPIDIKNYSFSWGDDGESGLAMGAHLMMDLLKDVEAFIPLFRAVFSPHDTPNLFTDYYLREDALHAAKRGTYLNVKDRSKAMSNGWLSACAPGSPAQQQYINWGRAPYYPPSVGMPKKTFIYDHYTSMDPCQHPSHFLLHGQFISHNKGPEPMPRIIPQFSYSPSRVHSDITFATPLNWLEDIYPREDDPEWDDRWDARLQWRGSNTGIYHSDDKRWDLAQRTRLMVWAGDGHTEGRSTMHRNVSMLVPVDEGIRVGMPVQARKEQWAPAMLDISFSGEVLNCAPEVCEDLEEIFEYRKRQDGPTVGKYKYFMDVDGNAWSSRFKRLITSNGLVFKSTIYSEWFMDRVAPWVHYVPIQNDFSDLWDTLVFFRGDPVGNGAHDDMAKKIAQDGREWSKTFWRKEDLVAYNFRLFLEYTRVMETNRESLSYGGAEPNGDSEN